MATLNTILGVDLNRLFLPFNISIKNVKRLIPIEVFYN